MSSTALWESSPTEATIPASQRLPPTKKPAWLSTTSCEAAFPVGLGLPSPWAQPSHWPASRHPIHDRQAEPRDRSRILHGRKDLGGRRRWHVSGSESYEAQHSAAVGLLDRHARRAGLLLRSLLSQGGAPRGPYVGYRRLHTSSVRALLFGKS